MAATDITFWQAPALAAHPWLAHGVTERRGGGSAGPFTSLNLGLHVGDDPACVVENRERAARMLGFRIPALVCAEQVHGGQVAVVTREQRGRGATAHIDALPGIDALVTNEPDILLALFFADCVPILLADPIHRAIGAAHAGWRGLAAGVIPNTLQAMARAFGTRPEDLLAAIGPAIGPCCYEVGPEVATHFPNHCVRARAGSERPHVDLPGVASAQFRSAGVRQEHVTPSGLCTSCLPDRFFSHRRDDGRTGRFGALIGILP